MSKVIEFEEDEKSPGLGLEKFKPSTGGYKPDRLLEAIRALIPGAVVKRAGAFQMTEDDQSPGRWSAEEDPLGEHPNKAIIILDAEDVEPVATLDAKPEEETCLECGRRKAHSWDDVKAGLCPKWFAIRDQAAEDDCTAHAKKAP